MALVIKGRSRFFCAAMVVLGFLGFAFPVCPEKVCLNSAGCFSERVGDRLLLVMDSRWQGPDWYVVREAEVVHLEPALPTLYQMVSLDATEDGRFLAVVTAGEGHPELLVLDLPLLLDGASDTVKLQIDPYPGMVAVSGWKGHHLGLESDRLLSRRPAEGGRIPEALSLYSTESFVLDMDTGRIDAVKDNLDNPVMYYIRHLLETTDQDAFESVLTALGTLNDPETATCIAKVRSGENLSKSQEMRLDALDRVLARKVR